MAGDVSSELEAPVLVKHVRIQLVDSNHLNLAEVELLISEDFADSLDSVVEADEEMMEIMSTGEQIGINHDEWTCRRRWRFINKRCNLHNMCTCINLVCSFCFEAKERTQSNI